MARGPARPVQQLPKASKCRAGMCSWLAAGYLEAAVKSALGGLRTLLQDSALSMSHDVDFGVVDLSSIATLSPDATDSLQRWQALLPPHAVRTDLTAQLSLPTGWTWSHSQDLRTQGQEWHCACRRSCALWSCSRGCTTPRSSLRARSSSPT